MPERCRKALSVLAIFFFFTGCAAGVRNLGSVTLKDGTTVEYIQVGSRGQDGPKMVVIEGYRYYPAANASEKESAYQASGPSLTADILRGTASAGIIAGGVVGAAAVLKPAVTKINQSQSGGGATLSGSGNSTNTNTAAGGSASTGAVTNTAAGGAGGSGGAGGNATTGAVTNTNTNNACTNKSC